MKTDSLRTSFYAFTTTRPVAITMVVIAVCVFGWVSYNRLALNLMPDISYPTLTVRTEYPGTAPEEVETLISRPLEQELGVVNGLVNISSISRAGFSDVVLEFTWDMDMDEAAQEIREKLDRVFLPLEAERPLILRYDPSLDPIMRIGIYGEFDLYQLRWLAEEDIKRNLETIPGVAAAKVKGGYEEEILVEINEQDLALLNLGIGQVGQRLGQENINLAGGNLKEGKTKYIVRTMNEFTAVEEINDIIVGQNNGVAIRVKDIGKVTRTHKEREVITRVNGSECVEIEIYKEADANIVSVAEWVRDRIFGTPAQKAHVENLKKQNTGKQPVLVTGSMGNFIQNMLPKGLEIAILSDQSGFIQNSIDEVRDTAIMGGILAIIVLYFFLKNLAHTLIVGLSIPTSLIATFAPMYLGGVSLNLMSLGGIALGIGMLVDNSIVVLESIFRCREEGDSIVQAAVRGTGEVGGAVIASTLTTVAVFFPLVFVEGIAGEIFGDMALTVVFSLLASLAIALTFIPMLASRKLDMLQRIVETSEVMRGASIHLDVIGRIKHELTDDESRKNGLLRRLMRGLVLGGLTILEVLHRVAANLLAFCGSAIKTVLIPAGIVLIPLFSLAAFVLKKENRIVRRIFELEQAPGNSVWILIRMQPAAGLDFHSLTGFFARIGDFYRWLLKGQVWFRIAKFAVILVPGISYLVLRFLVELLYRFTGKLALALAAICTAILESVFVLIGLIMYPVVNVFVNAFDMIFKNVQRTYPGILRFALDHPGKTIAAAFIPALICWFYLMPNLGRELIPEVHQGEFIVNIRLPVGTPVEETARVTAPIEAYLQDHALVERVSSIVGAEKTSTTAADEGEHTAKLSVVLKDVADIVTAEETVIQDVRSVVRDLSGISSKISRPVLFSFKTPVELEIRGYNLSTLKSLSREVEEDLAQIPGLYDVRSNIREGYPEVQIFYNRDYLAQHNLDIRTVANLVQNKVLGTIATKYNEEDRKIDIRVRVREEDKQNVEDLRKLVVNPLARIPLPLEAVATITVDEGPNEIRRIDQQRAALITANVSGIDLGTINRLIDEKLRRMSFPPDFTFSLSGQNKEMETSLNSLIFALLLAVFLIYVVMASQFESLIQPFIIMFSIPLAFIGVIALLYFLNIPLSVVVFIGIIVLAGIVVNNAIVLLDYANFLRSQGMDKREAIIQAGSVRLRPILMTSLTTILGLLPMAMGLGEGAEIRTPMAITVIAGLISSTVLTLVIIPAIYYVIDFTKKNN